MVIPADLPALVAPVAWMLGTWEGWGMYAAPGAPADAPAEDSPVIEEIRGDVVGEQMRQLDEIYIYYLYHFSNVFFLGTGSFSYASTVLGLQS